LAPPDDAVNAEHFGEAIPAADGDLHLTLISRLEGYEYTRSRWA
jgi:hypothetical protein